MQRITVLLLVATLALPAGAFAQEAQAVDPTKMGVDLSRIKRELNQAPAEETTETDPLRLRFTVEVVGTAPKIDLLEGFNVRGPLPYGPPTQPVSIALRTGNDVHHTGMAAWWVCRK